MENGIHCSKGIQPLLNAVQGLNALKRENNACLQQSENCI